jgi:hypothetical protein
MASRRNATVVLSRNLSESDLHVDALAAASPSPSLPRKKSGELLKSSLKGKRTPSRDSLTGITDPVCGLRSSESKSAPATPAHKGVHFPSQLEHVKLFLAEQKPLAVSGDDTLTDTSEADIIFPLFIQGHIDNSKEWALVMRKIDVPRSPPLAGDSRDVALEDIELVGITIEGVVRVRNITFDKWIVVRFTFNKWQTTSEVTARYKEAVPDSHMDRFVFAIKLEGSAEEKTIYLAIRYSVAGREIWDNNNGRNYQVQIAREKSLKANKETTAEKPEESSHADDIADLRRQLEQVVKHHSESETIGGILAQHSRRRWESPPLTPSPPPRDAIPSFKSEGYLAARYDFAASLHTPWRAPVTSKMPSHSRSNSVPYERGHSPRPASSCSAPRDKAEDSLYFPDLDSDRDRDLDDIIARVPSLHHGGPGFCSRNHARGVNTEFSYAPGIKHRSPTSPLESLLFPTISLSRPTSACPEAPSCPHFNPFPPHPFAEQEFLTQDWISGASEERSPSIANSPSSSFSWSPSLSPAEPPSPTRLMLHLDDGKSDSPIHQSDYLELVNRYVNLLYRGTFLDADNLP